MESAAAPDVPPSPRRLGAVSDGGFDDVSGEKAPAANNELVFDNKENQRDIPREEKKMQKSFSLFMPGVNKAESPDRRASPGLRCGSGGFDAQIRRQTEMK